MALGTLIRNSRVQRRLSLSALARQARVSKSYLHRLEKSSERMRPSADVLYRLGIVLGLRLPQMLNRPTEDLLDDDLTVVPEPLRQFAVEEQLPREVVLMLGRIQYLGARPGTVDDFSFLLGAIKRAVRVPADATTSVDRAGNTSSPDH